MKVLPRVEATNEQLVVLKHEKKGILIVRGAAGSGKTTTALLRLKVVTEFFAQQFNRNKQQLNILVLTYNRTLAGYIEALANAQVQAGLGGGKVSVLVDTFAGWAKTALEEKRTIIDVEPSLANLGSGMGLDKRFLANEVEYALGRFLPGDLQKYLTAAREGRGTSPAMPRPRRERLMNEVITPYLDWKKDNNLVDWNDLAVTLATTKLPYQYHIVVVDETQDFHANRIRAILNQLANPAFSLTFVLDGAQRIYPHHFKWAEVGITATSNNVRQLTKNYRNTSQIAAFAAPLVDGMDIGDDGAVPDFSACDSTGPKPMVLEGLYSKQAAWAIDYIKTKVNLETDSVAFLHPKGWFNGRYGNPGLKQMLDDAGLQYEEITRERDWPVSKTNIAVSTMASAKGLEFDHVIAIGLSGEATQHGTDQGDVTLEELRRLLAMAIGRAKKSVVVGYKPSEATVLVKFFKKDTFDLVKV